MSLEVVNISVRNAVMPKEFYWDELRIDRLNEALSRASLQKTSRSFELCAPRMPLNTSPLCVTLHVRNLSDTEMELKIFKQLLCDCSVTMNRLRREGKRVTCAHKGVVEMRPAYGRVKPNNTQELELTFRYELPERQEVHFTIASSGFTLQMQVVVTTNEFDPASLLITNRLIPVAINLLPAPQQALWLYNFYTIDVEMKLISCSPELSLADELFVVKSRQHAPLFLTFTPSYVGSYELEIEFVFHGCKSSTTIYGECTGPEQDLLDLVFRSSSPNYDLISQSTPFVLRGDNLCIALPQNGISSDNSIELQNNSTYCIKFEWDDIEAAVYPFNISVEPKSGLLKPGFFKHFQISAQSSGSIAMIKAIPLKCSVFQYSKTNFREYHLPDGYFEYTDDGYYEKPSNWSPDCFKFLQSLFVNISMRVISSLEIIKYATMSENRMCEDLMRQCLLASNKRCVPLNELGNDSNLTKPKRDVGDDERHMKETLIGLLLHGAKYEVAQKLRSHGGTYATLDEILDEKRKKGEEGKLVIPKLMDDLLLDCIAEISKDQRFVPEDSSL